MKSESRSNAEVFIGLGANLGTPRQTFELALALIGRFAKVNSVSKLYRSLPFGYADQPPFINAAACIATDLEPEPLLAKMKDVEGALGKEVICENGPRVIDIDLLLFQDQSIHTKDLILPHPAILSRDFVIRPLLDLNSELHHPSWGAKTLKSALSGLQERFVRDEPEGWDLKL